MDSRALARGTVAAVLFAATLTLRIRGIDRHFWMLRDQIRDWALALGSFGDLPLVGPATHVGGHTIGPAFYWILWLIRVLVGPWFDNLPHAGGIGQAIVQSGADALLLIAIWRKTQSPWIALATTILLSTAAYDLALASLVWNPMMGAALSKIAIALVLTGWPERSLAGLALTAAVAWAAVHCYTGAIFTALSVFAALVLPALMRRDRKGALRAAAVIVAIVAILQLPLVIYQISAKAGDSAMGAVTGSLNRIASGQAQPQFGHSWTGFAGAVTFIQGAPWHRTWLVWILVAAGIAVAIRYRHDATLLAVTLLPQLLAIAGYAFYVGDFLDAYYYFPLIPAVVLTLVLGLTAWPAARASRAAAIALVLIAIAITSGRVRFAATMHRMPEYGWLLDGSRQLAARGVAVKGIRTQFPLPPSADPEFLYRILGGRIDPGAHFTALITREGQVAFRAD